MRRRILLIAAVAAALMCASCSSMRHAPGVNAVQPTLEQEECDIENHRKEHGANDKPLPVKISWNGGDAAKILVSKSPEFEDAFEVAAEASPAEVFNLVPGEKYYYKVLAADGKVLKQAIVVPVGPLRMINGVVGNMRDLGGWKANGGHIAYGKLYRGAALERISPSGRDIFLCVLYCMIVIVRLFQFMSSRARVFMSLDLRPYTHARSIIR